MNKKRILLITFIAVFIVIIGVSYARFESDVNFGGGTDITGSMWTSEDSAIKLIVNGNLTFDDSEIYPGHKSVSAVNVSAEGNGSLTAYKLIWNGTNTFNTELNYYVYKSSSEINGLNVTCIVKTNVKNGIQYLTDKCTMNKELGELVSTGVIPTSSTSISTTILDAEFINASASSGTTYYYVVIEYPDKTESQNNDIGNSEISGKLIIEPSDVSVTINLVDLNDNITTTKIVPSKNLYYFDDTNSTCTNNVIPVWDNDNWSLSLDNLSSTATSCNLYFDMRETAENYILAHSKIGEGTPNFANTSCSSGCDEATVGWYEAEDDYSKTYYFRGDVNDNYVKFAGFYWRIIRINGNGSIRMIYSGKVSEVDAAGKEIVLANGYDDSETKYTQIGTSTFNNNANQSEYVGYMYTLGSAHGIGTKSTILEVLETWYTDENNELQNYEEYLDIESGFCGDRSAYTDSSGTTEGGGTGTTTTYYGAYDRIRNKYSPTMKCPNSEDLYKTKIGLITVDEAAFAGGKPSSLNRSYYLYTGNWYWTLSPNRFDGTGTVALAFDVDYVGRLNSGSVTNSDESVRPVINLRADNLTITGRGTIQEPYDIS